MTEQPPRPADPRRYTDLRLELRDLDGPTGCYTVSLSGALGEFDGTARLAEDELADPLAELADGGIEEDEDRIAFGQALADRLLPDGDIRTQVTEAIRRAGTGTGVRLRLVTREPRLAALPWEYTYLSLLNREDLADFMVLNPTVSLVRHEQLPLPLSDLHAAEPAELRLLAVTANAPGYPQLDLKREREALETALARLPADLPRLTYQPVLENPTAAKLQVALTGRADLFHFAGHGGVHGTTGYLALPPADGAPGELSADRLGRLLQAAGVRLAVLGACDSGRRGRSQWTGVVPGLVAVAAIPAVVAMQYPVRNSAAVMFASAFYTAVAAGLSVDEAVWSGRLALQDPDDLSASWGIPVLYLRSSDGVLFPRLAERPSETASKLRSIVDLRVQSVKRGAVTRIDEQHEEMAPPSTADDGDDPAGERPVNELRPRPSQAATAAAKSSPGDADPFGAAVSVQSALTELGRLLAELIPAEDEAKRIVRDSGNATTEDWWSRSPRSFWDTALADAHRAWRMEALFASLDEVLAKNPAWCDAKAQYLEARAAVRRSPPRYLAPARGEAFGPYEASLQAIEKALDRIVPAIFRDPRISAAVLNAASAALVSLNPLVEALRAAAEAEIQQRPRFELQQLDGSLRRHKDAISQQLSALQNVRSETTAEPLCRDLAVERAGLLATGARAIRLVA